MAGKGRKHRSHPKRALPLQNPLLQIQLMRNIILRQRAQKPVKISHPVPRKVSRTGKICPDLILTHTKTLPHLHPDSLLTGNRQRHIDAIESHPVDEPLPVFPLPPQHSITESAIIQEKALFKAALLSHNRINLWQHIRDNNLIILIPRDPCVAIIIQIPTEPLCNSKVARSLYDNLPILAAQLKHLPIPCPLQITNNELRRFARHNPLDKLIQIFGFQPLSPCRVQYRAQKKQHPQ